MTIDAIKAHVDALVQAFFDNAAQTFNDNPSPDNWEQLIEAMWVRQACAPPYKQYGAFLAFMLSLGEQHRGS